MRDLNWKRLEKLLQSLLLVHFHLVKWCWDLSGTRSSGENKTAFFWGKKNRYGKDSNIFLDKILK